MRHARILIAVMAILTTLGCNLIGTSTLINLPPTPTLTPTALPTATAIPLPTFTPVVLPPVILPTAIPPLPTAIPATPTPEPARIRFATGATAATLPNQAIAAGGVLRYVLGAMSGQALLAEITPLTAAGGLSLTVYGVSGTLLGRTAPGVLSWTGALPASGDYVIEVTNIGAPAAFNLAVTIPRRVTIPAGETTVFLGGSVTAPSANTYLLSIAAGQMLMVDASTPGGNIWLAVRGLDGTVLLGPEQGRMDWAGAVPAAQDYLISVGGAAGTAEYTLQITLPKRIVFATGATSATIMGNLAGRDPHLYTLEAGAGQIMSASVSAPSTGNNVWLTISGADGTVLLRPEALQTIWMGRLPASQVYILTVQGDGNPAAYTLQVSIARRVSFTPGSTSTVLEGTIVLPEGVEYVLEARAGQTLTYSVTPGDRVYVTLVGADGSPLARYQPSWSGVLPLTQDYLLRVAAAGGATGIGYRLEISITG
ncbi:MAG: hypothetical protein HPY64_08790 [Anaerolineae bacterium]|nr:hypothetical protein [Anaerolineae bacterium]